MNRNVNKKTMLILGLSVVFALSACVSSTSQSSASYAAGQAQREMTVRFASVESVRDVVIEEEVTPTGTIAGAAVGGIAGSALSHGSKESAIGAIVGAVVGGIAGNAVSNSQSKKEAVDITVKLEHNNEYRVLVQEKDPKQVFQKGDRVRLVSSGNVTKITKEVE